MLASARCPSISVWIQAEGFFIQLQAKSQEAKSQEAKMAPNTCTLFLSIKVPSRLTALPYVKKRVTLSCIHPRDIMLPRHASGEKILKLRNRSRSEEIFAQARISRSEKVCDTLYKCCSKAVTLDPTRARLNSATDRAGINHWSFIIWCVYSILYIYIYMLVPCLALFVVLPGVRVWLDIILNKSFLNEKFKTPV